MIKIKYKAAGIMSLFGAVIVIILTTGFELQSHKIAEEMEFNNIANLAKEVAMHLNDNIVNKTTIAMTLGTSPLLKESLKSSNADYSKLSTTERDKKIDELNQKWKDTKDVNDPFIQSHTTNPMAEYLKQQQITIPGIYGEIFLTNSYGVMIATTGKLSTLSHSHKYWWKESHDNDRIFLDDRGFDESVDGYVLGIVVPIKDSDEIIGILKCNINIQGPITNIVSYFSQKYPGKLQIVRTKGAIVAEYGVTPLSTQINKKISVAIQKENFGALKIVEHDVEYLVSYSPVTSTLEKGNIIFGGSEKSFDHSQGNEGEGWYTIVRISVDIVEENIHQITKFIMLTGIIFIILTSLVALFMGIRAAAPISKLSLIAHKLEQGDLTARVIITREDEIGELGKSLNRMSENLERTMTSRDQLIVVQEKLKIIATIDDLTKVYNRRAFNRHLKTEMSKAKRHNKSLGLLLIDIDFFKKINDTIGHDAGDITLQNLASIVNKNIRIEDIFARWGGEEFMLLLPHTGKSTTIQLAERLRIEVSKMKIDKSIPFTISIGATILHNDDSCETFVKRSDIALYEAKEGGRNRVCFNE